MMKAPKLSYIIPTYNNEDEVLCCIDSILSLPLKDDELEIIVIDDCSKDRTREQLDNYAISHPQLKLIYHEVNQRPGASTNQGIAAASGEFIAFSDGDDEVVVEGVMNAVKAMDNSDVDICYYDFEYEHPLGMWHKYDVPQSLRNSVIPSAEYLENYYSVDYNAVWRYVVRASFLKELPFRMVEGIRWEDCDWTVKMQISAQKICFTDGVGYRYGYSPNAVSRQDDYSALAERTLAGIRMYELAGQICISHPKLSDTILQEAQYRYLEGSLRFRNVTKYTFGDICRMFSHFDRVKERNNTQYMPTLKGWLRVMLNARFFALIVLFFACPLAACGRLVVRCIRK